MTKHIAEFECPECDYLTEVKDELCSGCVEEYRRAEDSTPDHERQREAEYASRRSY